ncbi:hypothetical protein CEF21_21460 [Bacillus sp. FJAT-42376]|uniref:hypothetical protein n=1 Tax=Bacillus sp. FJAT-42376 TaxID=2014076 RepID=UPI000F4E6DF0|nr:hypothetical protein [Bacillus sp. FJAT-42376]AZB44650.1 hypothetical protein CEF21_21460 [Bacillus sp. FJAT-42376]
MGTKEKILNLSFVTKELFHYIYEQSSAFLFVTCSNAKETLQTLRSKEAFLNGEKYWGAIQYEQKGTLVSFRFKRQNIPSELRMNLEEIKEFRRDKNEGPEINPKAESIAFKFSELDSKSKPVIQEIIACLKAEQERFHASRNSQ